jgi:hypothetical protein
MELSPIFDWFSAIMNAESLRKGSIVMKNKTVALILSIFLGGLGIDRFSLY